MSKLCLNIKIIQQSPQCFPPSISQSISIWKRFRSNSDSSWPFPPFFCTHLGMPIESEIIDRFRHLRCLNYCIKLPNMIGSFASGTMAYQVAKNGTKKVFHSVDKIITCGHILLIKVSRWPSWHKYCNQTKLSRFGLASVTMAAILGFQNYISQPFEVLKGSNSVLS